MWNSLSEGENMAGTKRKKGALVVVVARSQRTEKVRGLTSILDDDNWESLCVDIQREMLGRSFLPDEPLFVLPHFEDEQTSLRESVHKNVRMLFEERNKHNAKCSIVVLSSFEEGGVVDRNLKRSFQIFLTVHGDQGNAFMVYADDVAKLSKRSE
jgi:hypothetical protein